MKSHARLPHAWMQLLLLAGLALALTACAGGGTDDSDYGLADAENLGAARASLKVVSINLRNNSDQMDRRFELLADEIVRLEPDLIGTQEVEIWSRALPKLRDLIVKKGGPRYNIYDHLKSGTNLFSGEGIGLMSRYKLDDTGYASLSEGRIVVWARVTVAPGVKIDFFNTHLHHTGGDTIRLPQAQKVLSYMKSKTGAAGQFLTGDMNAGETSGTIKAFVAGGLADSFKEVHGANTASLGATSPIILQEGAVQNPRNRIDFVFSRGSRLVPTAAEVTFKNHDAKGFYPSDHLGVFTTFDVY